MRIYGQKVTNAPKSSPVTGKMFTVIVTLALTACGASHETNGKTHLAEHDNQPGHSSAGSGDVIGLFEADGMTQGLTNYYLSRGFSRSGSPVVTPYAHGPRQCNHAGCFDYYDVTQTFANASGETRTIKEIAGIGDAGFNQIMDSYNSRGMFPERFVAVGDESPISLSSKGLGSFVNFAGKLMDADMGFTRIGNVTDAFKYFFARNLTCSTIGDVDSCQIVFIKNSLTYTYDANYSREIVNILRAAQVKPTMNGTRTTYRAEFVDCGDYQPGSYPKDDCWIIARK